MAPSAKLARVVPSAAKVIVMAHAPPFTGSLLTSSIKHSTASVITNPIIVHSIQLTLTFL